MPRLKKRADGRFRASFTYQNKVYYVYSKNRSELETLKAEKLKELQEAEENYQNPKLDSYYETFTRIRSREIKESTIRAQTIQYNVIAHTELRKGLSFGQMRVRDIKRKDIEKAREILLDSGKTPQYLNNCFAHLNHVFNSALIDETIDKNPCRALKPLRRTDPLITDNERGKHRALTEEETEKFFAAAADSYYLNLFKLMINTGMRIGEATALYPTDIDSREGYIHVRRSIIRNSVGGYEVGQDTKTTSGTRDIPMTDEVNKIIQNQYQYNLFVFGKNYTGLLFPSPEKNILREYTVNRSIKRICKKAGIEEFTCHAFRATYATRFIEQRPDDYKTLSEVLGHKDVSISLNLYTHVMRSRKVEAINAVHIKTG